MSEPPVRRRPSWIAVTLVCWLLVVLDGYDLIVYGTVAPALLDEPAWRLTESGIGTLGSVAFVGMMAGALTAGRLCDRYDRRRVILASVACFSLFSLAGAVAASPTQFGTFRFLAGLGLGGLVPSVTALVHEVCPPARRGLVTTAMLSGIPLGGTAASLLGASLIPQHGWRVMFWLAAIGLLALPLAGRILPRRALPDAAAPEPVAGRPKSRTGMAAIWSPSYRRTTLAFCGAALGTLLFWYGLATWLPQLMRESGYDLGSAITFLLALNLGAVAGSLVAARLSHRFGALRTATCTALLGAVSLALLSTHPDRAGTYLLVALAGTGGHTTQCLLNVAVAGRYPDALRGTGLGALTGIGRIGAITAPLLGGWLLQAGFGVRANFTVFGAAAALAAVLTLVVPRLRAQDGAAARTARTRITPV
ncbi:aromatic acid/H+ symport family MFS transporter [Streptomyces formicae]|uniref:Aromatic acid/H+ symport family MFS transporter n=1 Tax=Streptomyces formicae TaxID=1616117 RepID=A0ABY3WR38_9ACTN|nr:aromatic acid/H+ symport family MFS transporter [Streptomyces formicae]UNM13010.1 aromatic acid/H+ symport family MFS transporter [Streptomyces formicae]